jgi:hypothetical protein
MERPSTRRARLTLVAVLVSVCCLAAAVGPGVVAGERVVDDGSTDDLLAGDSIDPSPTGSPPGDIGPITRCFTGEGYPLAIGNGNGSARIDAAVHASVLTDPAAGDEVGVELAGSLDRARIVTLAAGVRLDAPGILAAGANPFAAFDLLYAYELRLPMFAGALDTSTYRGDGPPVGSAADAVPCRR